MSTKTAFKRVALAVVVALGLGALASGPSNAVIQSGATLAIASGTASITAGETATATLTLTYTSIGATTDSMGVTAIRTSATAPTGVVNEFRTPVAADSSGALVITRAASNATAYADATADKVITTTLRYDFRTSVTTAAGTYTYTFYPFFGGTQSATLPGPVTFSVTVAAADLKPSATTSKVVLGTGTQSPFVRTAADSSLVVQAGTVGDFAIAGTLAWDQQNAAASTSITAESVTVIINGAGSLSIGGSATRASAVTARNVDTVTVWADGRTGTGTITVLTTSMPTWATKTLTFAGTASSASIAVPKLVLSTSASANTVRITPKDSSGNLVTTAASWYLHSSDTKVITNSTSPIAASAATAALGYGTFEITARLFDSGTAKIKFANFAADSTTPTTGAIVTNEVEVSVVGSPATFKLATNKKSYKPGEVATITISVFDGLGKAIADTAIASMLTSTGVTANAATTSSGDTITTTAATHGQGKYSYEFTMPSTGGNVVFKATGSTGLLAVGQVAVYETVTVTDPAEEAANSALDAAQEATDAAIAATDAAVLAQESADAAAVAAEAAAETAAEAADAAKAAVDAVTKLSAEVTKLLTQFATLQKLMTRIAKKVGVKV